MKAPIITIVPEFASGAGTMASLMPHDRLAHKLDELAISMADELKGSGFDIHEKTEALKALTSYFSATRGKGAGPPTVENAFSRYRAEQGAE